MLRSNNVAGCTAEQRQSLRRRHGERPARCGVLRRENEDPRLRLATVHGEDNARAKGSDIGVDRVDAHDPGAVQLPE